MTGRDWADSPYVRVYQTIQDDPKFAKVYWDDRALAAYLRLLMEAEAAYPRRAVMPAWLTRQSRQSLIKAGVLIIEGQTYTLSGLAKERESRAASSTDRSRTWRSRRNGIETVLTVTEGTTPGTEEGRSGDADATLHAVPIATVMQRPRARVPAAAGASSSYSYSFSSSENVPRAGAGEGAREADPYAVVVQWLASRSAWVDSPKIEVELARMTDRKGSAVVIAAMDAVPNAETAAQFVYGARNALFPLAATQTVRPLSREEQEQADSKRRLDLLSERRKAQVQS